MIGAFLGGIEHPRGRVIFDSGLHPGVLFPQNLYAVGCTELLHVGVLRKLDRAVHEHSPDRRGGIGALQCVRQAVRNVGIVVIAHPDDAEKIRRIAGEPDVVRGPCLACCGRGEASLARC